MNTNMEGGVNETGQTREQLEANPEAHKESLEKAVDQSPKEQIIDVLGEMDSIDREIFDAQKSITERKQKMGELRKGMAMPPTDEESPVVEVENERIKKLEAKRSELRGKKEALIDQYGIDNLPEGIAIESGDNGREANAGLPEEMEAENRKLTEEEKREREEEKKEDLEFRKEWLKHWAEKAVKNFEKAMKEDWLTKDAANLEMTIALMKIRVPKAMDKELEDFVNGKVDQPPFSTVRIEWECASPLERLLGKVNQVSKLDITFDNKQEPIASQYDLKPKEDKKADETPQAAR